MKRGFARNRDHLGQACRNSAPHSPRVTEDCPPNGEYSSSVADAPHREHGGPSGPVTSASTAQDKVTLRTDPLMNRQQGETLESARRAHQFPTEGARANESPMTIIPAAGQRSRDRVCCA
jgi:hypothetical protein